MLKQIMNQKESMIIVTLDLNIHTYILVKGTMAVTNMAAAGATVNDINKKVIFRNCAPLLTA